ncbi:Maleylacetoacetate isomerase [Nymphon striatum]|nr:Maleylacetoacetate isomerase [Nymphon striatum]
MLTIGESVRELYSRRMKILYEKWVEDEIMAQTVFSSVVRIWQGNATDGIRILKSLTGLFLTVFIHSADGSLSSRGDCLENLITAMTMTEARKLGRLFMVLARKSIHTAFSINWGISCSSPPWLGLLGKFGNIITLDRLKRQTTCCHVENEMVKRCEWGLCNSDSRYPERLIGGVEFIPFPKPKRNLETCKRWIKACGRPHEQLNTTSALLMGITTCLAWKGIEYETIPVHLVKDGGEQFGNDYTKQNPNEEVPTLLMNDEVFTQSASILEYLEEVYPTPPLLPKDPKERAKVRAIVETIGSGIQPIQNLRVLMKLSDSKKERADWANYWISNRFQSLEKMLEDTAGEYCVGDQVTFADLFLAPQVYNAERFSVDISQYPMINKVNGNLKELDAYKQSEPKNQPDCPEEQLVASMSERISASFEFSAKVKISIRYFDFCNVQRLLLFMLGLKSLGSFVVENNISTFEYRSYVDLLHYLYGHVCFDLVMRGRVSCSHTLLKLVIKTDHSHLPGLLLNYHLTTSGAEPPRGLGKLEKRFPTFETKTALKEEDERKSLFLNIAQHLNIIICYSNHRVMHTPVERNRISSEDITDFCQLCLEKIKRRNVCTCSQPQATKKETTVATLLSPTAAYIEKFPVCPSAYPKYSDNPEFNRHDPHQIRIHRNPSLPYRYGTDRNTAGPTDSAWPPGAVSLQSDLKNTKRGGATKQRQFSIPPSTSPSPTSFA